MRLFRIVVLGYLLVQAARLCAQTTEIVVQDRDSRPLAATRVEIKDGSQTVATAQTDTAGHAILPPVKPGRYTLTASKDGFETLTQKDIELPKTGIELTLV